MLAILQIKMHWTKESRTPDSAHQRQGYYKPVRIEGNVDSAKEGIFLKKCQYFQRGGTVTGETREAEGLDAQKLNIPCVEVVEEPGHCYRIKWFDSDRGMPRRRGGNEDLYKEGARLAGRPNTLNETAFILKPGQAGLLKYNYRFNYYDGQCYECYYVYMVNAEKLKRNVFLRKYDFEYEQLADLF